MADQSGCSSTQPCAAQLKFALLAARAEISKLHREMNALKKHVNRELQAVRRDALAAAASAATVQRGLEHGSGSADLECLGASAAEDGACHTRPTAGDWPMSPIGFVESVFACKNGTPRQPGIVPAAPARLRVRWGTSPAHALEGLGAFSHVWLLWIFDRNGGEAAKAKARPPRMLGGSTGVFACRTPHRPNPIGLSLVALRSVRADVLYFDGADLCDGTPILDIKPYVAYADAPPLASLRVAGWAADRGTGPYGTGTATSAWGCRASFTPEARASLRAICCTPADDLPAPAAARTRALRFFRGDPDRAEVAFLQTLAADPRSKYRKEKCAEEMYQVELDGIDAACRFDGNEVTVERICLRAAPSVQGGT
jgi:tRNA-Thr(GGU) m(6)t(6)A37 methyltransferase TsaA